MQATLIYNPNAGGVSQITADELQKALQEAGYFPVYEATSSEADLDPALANVQGIVVVAGGDGTLRAVATRLIGKKAPLALIPLGTANNIARTFGVQGTPLEIIAGLANARRCEFDVGYVRSPWGADYFLEGLGYGLYADVLAMYDPAKGKSIPRGITAFAQTLANYEPPHTQMTLDGENISGYFLWVEVLNTPTIGPRLKLAPNADPTDGLLEIVRIRQDARDGFLRYTMSLLAGELEELPSVDILRGHKLEIAWTGFPIHVDAEVRPPASDEASHEQGEAKGARPANDTTESIVTVEVLPKAIEFWLPSLESS